MVTKVEAEDLPADTFAVPAGYQKQQMGMMGGPGAAGTSPSGAPANRSGASRGKIPE
jgi:hypothetical protein